MFKKEKHFKCCLSKLSRISTCHYTGLQHGLAVNLIKNIFRNVVPLFSIVRLKKKNKNKINKIFGETFYILEKHFLFWRELQIFEKLQINPIINVNLHSKSLKKYIFFHNPNKDFLFLEPF